jgi:hypothetical protein
MIPTRTHAFSGLLLLLVNPTSSQTCLNMSTRQHGTVIVVQTQGATPEDDKRIKKISQASF